MSTPQPQYQDLARFTVPKGFRGRDVFRVQLWWMVQATLFRPAYRRCGEVLHREGAFLLEGRVEQTAARGFAFLVDRVESLREALAGASVPTPRVASSPGAFLRAGRRGRKAS